jgi:uncharacterized membrane protein YiaA
MVSDIVAWIIAIVVVAGLVLYLVGLYNTFVRMALANDQAFANIDSVLRQRHDEILKLVNACQAYMAICAVSHIRCCSGNATGTSPGPRRRMRAAPG